MVYKMNKYQELANITIIKTCDKVMEHYKVEPKSLTDDIIENPALLNGVPYFDLEDDVANDIKTIAGEKEGFFRIPAMTICRDDIALLFEGSDAEEEVKIQVQKLSDESMQRIADKMVDGLMTQFHLSLGESFKEVISEDLQK